MSHRIYHCSAVAGIRASLGCEHLSAETRSTLVWGLFKRPEALDSYMKALNMIEVERIPSLPSTGKPDLLFCDGSCSQPSPQRKTERIAAYAVRQATEASHESSLLISGILPGSKQTAFRAELFGFMCAMCMSVHSVIFTDCKSVWMGITRLQREGWNPLSWMSSADSDMWYTAWTILDQPGRLLTAEWVESHRSLSTARSAHDAWKIYHNGLVDKSASVNTVSVPAQIQSHLDQLKLQNRAYEVKRNEIVTFLKSIWDTHAAAEAVRAGTAVSAGQA